MEFKHLRAPCTWVEKRTPAQGVSKESSIFSQRLRVACCVIAMVRTGPLLNCNGCPPHFAAGVIYPVGNPPGRERFGAASNYCENLEKQKMSLTIKSVEVPVLQEDIPNYDWFCILSALGWPQSRPVEEHVQKIQINILETWYGISSPTYTPELNDRSGVKVKAHLKGLPELTWIQDTTSEAIPHAKPASCSEADILLSLEPLELLKFEELHGSGKLASVIPAHVLGHTAHRERLAGKDLDCPFLNSDFQLLTQSYTRKLEYDNVVDGPTETLRDVLEEENNTDCPSSPGTGEIQETFMPEEASFSLELPLFCDKLLTMSSVCIHSLTCANDITAPQIPLESLSEGLNAGCFESLIVTPELRPDDRQIQSIPTPLLAELPVDELQITTITSVSLNCRPSPMTATDWLYLDWHFAHGKCCNDAACFKLHAKLEEDCKPTKGVNNIRVNSCKHRSKIALNILGLESDSGSGISSTCEENPITAEDYDQPNSALQEASQVSQDGKVASIRVCQIASAREGGKRTDCHFSVVSNENVELKRLEVPVTQPEIPFQHIPTQPRCIRASGDTLQDGSAAELIIGDELIFNLSGLQDGERSSRNNGGLGSGLDDLTCFVQARKGVLQYDCRSYPRADCEEKTPDMMNNVPMATPAEITSVDGGEIFSPIEHAVELSVEIRTLLITLSSDYHGLLALKEIIGKDTVQELDIAGKFGFDSLGNNHVMSLMKKTASEQPTQQRQILLRGLTALHVLRHTALNLCTYGIRVAHLHLENFFDRIRFLEGLILNSRIELEDAYTKVERGTCQDHPKLQVLERLLRGRSSSRKILLISDRRAVFTLYKKLLSSGFTPYQIDRKEQYLQRGQLLPDVSMKLKEEIIQALSFSNCLLVPYAYITDSFPIENFALVIQYEYSGTDTAVEDVLQRGRCERHIFKALVNPEEVNPSVSTETAPNQADDNLTIKQAQDCLSEKISKLLEPSDNPADLPRTEGSNLAERKGSFGATTCSPPRNRTMPIPSSPTGGWVTENDMRSIDNDQFIETGYEMILVANISQQNRHRWSDRRSSYQKILSYEKQSIQVVERELRLPVDLILSPATCLLIYTRPTSEEVPLSFEHEQSSLRTEVDIILKAISFAYRDCILIFEGPTDFTSAVLDVFCDVHAMAIWLELQVQCFISDGVGITDKIVMRCIEAARQTKLLKSYPAMTETPTIAEAFLTEFPTINPLTAHAVLSSGCPLRTFLALSLEQQFSLVQDTGVPRHSMELFKAQCDYRDVTDSFHTERPDFGSQVTHHRNKYEGKKERGYIVLTKEQRDDDLDIDPHLSGREPTFASWSSYPYLPTIFGQDSESQIENLRNDVSLVESTYFPEFPPAYEVTGDSKLTASGIESEKDYLPPDDNILGHESTFDQDFLLEKKLVGISTPPDDCLPLLPPKLLFGGQDNSFMASLDKLRASLSGWDDHGRNREGCNIGEHRKIQQSYRNFDCWSPHTRGPFASSGEFYSSTSEKGGHGVTQSSQNLIVPYRSKPNCKGQRLQNSLDRYRYRRKNSKSPGICQTTLNFPRIYPPIKERQLQSPHPSVVTGYVPVDKKSKKLLGLTRRGSDRQQRLVWIKRNNDIHDVSKRQKKDPIYGM